MDFLYVNNLFQAWSENDPYRQIEEDVSKLIEEMKPVGN
jgi:hypothetical protein